MTKIVFALTALIVLLIPFFPVNGGPDGTFEGVITYRMTGDDVGKKAKNSPLEFMVKGNKVRIEVQKEGSDVSEDGAIILIDMSTSEYVTMIEKDGQKMAMSFGIDEFKEMIADVKKNNKEEKETRASVEVAEETKKINGYKCQQVVMASEKRKNTAWITREISIDFTQLFPIFETTENWERYAEAYDGFVMKVRNKDLETEESYSYIASVDEKAMEDQLFSVPHDYEKVNMGKMMDEFKDANPEVYEKMLKQLQH